MGVSSLPGKKRYEGLRFDNVISVTREWVGGGGVKFPGKKRYVTQV